jgi:SOS response regulatory protein OraA/RecX
MGRECLVAELTARAFQADAIARAVRSAYEGTTERAIAERFLMSLPARHTDYARESRRRAGLLRGRGFSDDVIESVLASAGHE